MIGQPTLLQLEQRSQAFPDLSENLGRRLRFKDDSPRFPIEVLHVVRKDDTGDCASRRKLNLEGVPLYLAGNGAGDCEACLRVIHAWREDEGRPAATLFMAGLWVKGQPDQIAGIRYVCAGYHNSCPTGVVPQSVSSWRLRFVILAARASSEYVGLAGLTTIAPPLTDTVTVSPSSSRASSATDFGSLSPKLLPHLAICVDVAMYIH